MKIKSMLLASVACGLFSPCLTAFAQDDATTSSETDATTEAASSRKLQTVYVSARKREESILKVPVSATAFSGESLEQYATGDIYDLTNRTPGLQVGTGTGSFGPQLSLRGIGTGTLNATIDQSVSLNVDGLSMTQGMAFGTALFDMQSAEVLRGPQSLFYGKNSTAGVISVPTKNPGDELEISSKIGYEFEAKQKVGEMILSGPITDTFGVRLAAKISDMEGYQENRATALAGTGALDPRYGTKPTTDEYTLRATALWEPTNDFTANLKINYNSKEVEGDGGAGQYISCPDGISSPIPGFIPQFLNPNEDCQQDDVFYVVDMDPAVFEGIRNGGTPFSDLEQVFGSLQMDWDISDNLILSSVTGYYDSDHAVMINGTVAGYAAPTIVADTDFKREEITQELRLTSDYDGALNFMLGAYYQDGEMSNRNGLIPNGPMLDTLVIAPGFTFTDFVNLYLRDGLHEVDVKAESLFGQVLWQVHPDVEISAGLRWNHEERNHTAYNFNAGWLFSAANPTGSPIIPTEKPTLESDHTSPEIAVTYTPTDNMTLFLSYKEGYKSGSFDSVSAVRVPGDKKHFDDESVEGFEGGFKGRFFDETLALNLAIYSYEYSDLQVGANEVGDDGVIAIRTINAASAKVEGVDFDFIWQPESIDGLTFNGIVTYNHSRYDDFNNAPCVGGQTFSEGCNLLPTYPGGNYVDDPSTAADESLIPITRYQAQDLSGRELLRAPEWTASLGLNYERPLNDGLMLNIGASTYWSDDFYHNILLRDDMIQESYFKHDLSVAVGPDDGKWNLAFIGKNLTDEITCGNSVNANLAVSNFFQGVTTGDLMDMQGYSGKEELICQTDRGRELWMEFSYNFTQ